MGFEPTTPTLARLCSTPELRPLLPRLTAARRIWRKAKLIARLIPAVRAARIDTDALLAPGCPQNAPKMPLCIVAPFAMPQTRAKACRAKVGTGFAIKTRLKQRDKAKSRECQ